MPVSRRRGDRYERSRRAGLSRAVWEVTARHWTAGGLPNRPEHVNWLAPIIGRDDWPAEARMPSVMRVPLPPRTSPDFDAYREHLGRVLGTHDRPQRLDLRVMADHVLVMPDLLVPRLLPEHVVYDAAPWQVPLGETRDRLLTWNPAGPFPHFLVAGLTGFGKTTLSNGLLLNLIRGREQGVPTRIFVVDPKRFALEAFRPYVDGFAPLPVPGNVRAQLEDGTIAPGWEARLELAKLQQIADLIRAVLQISVSRQIRAGDRRGAWRIVHAEGRVFVLIDEAIALFQYEKMTGTSQPARDAQQRDALRQQSVADLGLIAFMGREVGVHLIVCTQRPDVTVLPGPVRAQLIGRLALRLDPEGSRMVTSTDLAFNSLPLDQPGRFWLIDSHKPLGWDQGQGFDAPEGFVEDELRRVA